MNSRQKGKRGERQWRDELRAAGYDARRGQQFCGSPDSPDVVCAALPWIHFEVKAVEKLNIWDAMDQARRECAAKIPIVAHKRNFRAWLVTMEAETFFRLLRGEFESLLTSAATRALPCQGQTDPDGVVSLPTNLHREHGAAGESQKQP
jgi:Holliday junction resolvase